tara:strand:- start:115 stop:828 length:714 start_codon:yes stop_codon:yes gene_type:complete
MDLSRCLQLFEIQSLKETSEDELRKKYHKLCLKYHPDKNSVDSKDQFIEIQQCYERLLEEKRSTRERPKEEETMTIYETLLSLFTVDNIEKMMQWLQQYQQREHIVYLHAKFQQLLDKDVYVHGDVYIPLWHRVLYRKDLVEDDAGTQEVFCIMIDDLPKHIKILENNDLLMYVSCVLSLGERIVIRVSEQKNVSVVVTETILENKYHIFLKEGIPKIQQGQVYDISELSNIIACFV